MCLEVETNELWYLKLQNHNTEHWHAGKRIFLQQYDVLTVLFTLLLSDLGMWFYTTLLWTLISFVASFFCTQLTNKKHVWWKYVCFERNFILFFDTRLTLDMGLCMSVHMLVMVKCSVVVCTGFEVTGWFLNPFGAGQKPCWLNFIIYSNFHSEHGWSVSTELLLSQFGLQVYHNHNQIVGGVKCVIY